MSHGSFTLFILFLGDSLQDPFIFLLNRAITRRIGMKKLLKLVLADKFC
jgi:hypothetical protein